MTRVFSRMMRARGRGFTLVETLVSAAVFAIVAVGIYNAYTAVLSVITVSRAKVVAMDLANEEFEIIRNMPYANVGLVSGIPLGVIAPVQTLTRSGYTFTATTTIRNIDDPFDGTLGGSPNDLSPADSKLIEIEIGCATCKNFQPIFVNTRVAPKNLETASTNGALFVRVLDANGQPVPDANVHIVNNVASPSIVIDDTTNVSGVLQIVDAPPGVNAYQITVTKSGYTTDKTYTPGAMGNPNPLKPHATVALQQVTQTSFVIDRISSVNISTVTTTCSPVPSVDLLLQGTRLIGTSPDVFKYSQNQITGADGLRSLANMEWDTYNVTITDTGYDIIGTNPPLPLSLLPNNTQSLQFVMAPKNPRTLVVSVIDSATDLPLASSTVRLEGPSGYDETFVTGRGFINQTDWSGGGGQASSTDLTRYFSSASLDTASPAGELKLHDSFGVYETNGELISSTFDTGSASNFHQLFRLPVDQPPAAGVGSVKMQIATNNDTETWNFVGPDGTPGTYYTSATAQIHSSHDNDRYLRYKVFFNTDDTAVSPNVSDIAFTFTSSCVPPGQVAFSDLASGTYDLTVSREGYTTVSTSVSVGSPWQTEDVVLTAQ